MRIIFVLPLFLLGACAHLMPESDNLRLESAYASPIEAEAAFDMVLTGLSEHASGEAFLRKDLLFGAPHSDEETVGPLRIASVLTENTSGEAFATLDKEIRSCIGQSDAADSCKLLVFSDSLDQKHGVGTNILGRALGLSKKDRVSYWRWKAYFVLQKSDGTFRVIHKQFEKEIRPDRIERKKLPVLDTTPLGVTLKR